MPLSCCISLSVLHIRSFPFILFAFFSLSLDFFNFCTRVYVNGSIFHKFLSPLAFFM